MLRKPCAKCPFRDDVPNYLRRDRRRQIYTSLTQGENFHCHGTVDYDLMDDEGEDDYSAATAHSAPCAGAMKLFLNEGVEPPSQLARCMVRLDRAGTRALAADPTPIRSLESWLDGPDGPTNEPDEDAPEPRVCCVVNHNCTAPAGWSNGGCNEDANAEHDCVCCGDPVCEECSIDSPPDTNYPGRYCDYCAESELDLTEDEIEELK